MKKKLMFVICLIIVFIVGLLIGTIIVSKNKLDKKEEPKQKIINEKIDNISIKYHNNEKYYIITDDYKGDYDYQEKSLLNYKAKINGAEIDNSADIEKLFNTTKIVDYEEYKEFCNRWKLNKKYNENNKKYMIVSYSIYGSPIVSARLANVVENNGKVSLYLWENISGATADFNGYFIVVPIEKNTYDKEIITTYTKEEYNNIVKYGYTYNPDEKIAYKPIIYIYPEKEMNVKVKLINSSLLTVSYPKYTNGWNVIASPNGNLKELNSNKNYYGLYYEASNKNSKIQNDGFVVNGNDTSKFLEEKLNILGLNEREINEFIIYWLPRLEKNKYNYIRFETKEEIDKYMPLEITPTPDSIIRVMMDFKPLNKKINIKAQKLTPQKRHGYSVVEWGGSEIK